MSSRLAVLIVAALSLALAQPAALGQEVRSIEPVGRHRLVAGGVARVVRSGTLRGVPRGTEVSTETNPSMDPPLAVSWDADGENVVLGVPSITDPGDYEVVLSWVDERGRKSGEKFTLTVDELPRLAVGALPHVVLLNGLQLNEDLPFGLGNLYNNCPLSPNSSRTFGTLENQLTEMGAPVLFFDNCKECRNCSIEKLGSTLGEFLARQKSTSGNSYLGQFDLIGHSMGGLIARAYLSGKQMASGLFYPPVNHRVRKLVTIGTPHFGSYKSADWGTQTGQLTPGSRFIWDLATWNQLGDDLRGVDAVAIAGNGCAYGDVPLAGDGMVPLTSASILFARSDQRTRIIPHRHSTSDYNDCPGLPLIASVDTMDHPTSKIIRSFLQDTSEWSQIGHTPAQDPYLSRNGGVLVALKDENDVYYNNITWMQVDQQYKMLPASVTNGVSLYFADWLPSGYRSFEIGTKEASVTGGFGLDSGGYASLLLKFGPKVTAVRSQSGTSGTGTSVETGGNIVISGNSLGPAGSPVTVTVGGTPLSLVSSTPTQIVAYLPNIGSGIASLKVSNNAGQHTINIMVQPFTPPVLAVAPAQLGFQAFVGSSTPPVQTLVITNAGGGTLNWTATSSAPWLKITPLSGSGMSFVTVTANPTGLIAGDYAANVRVSSPGLPDRTIPVTFTVLQVAVPLTPDLQTVNLTTAPGDGSGLTQDLRLSSSKSLNFTVSVSTESGGNWLSANPVSGRTPATVTIVADASNLELGEYSGKLVVASDGASNGPQVVDVKLTVGKSVSIHSIINEASLMPVLASGGRTVINGRFPVTAFPEGTDVCTADATGVLPTVLCGVKVTINGAELPLFSVRATSIHLLMPREYGPGSLQVTVDDLVSVEKSVEILPAAPGLYRLETGLLAAKSPDDVVHDIAAPILTDTEENRTIMFLATGAGVSGDLAVPMGTPVPDDIVYRVSWPEVLKIDDVQLEEGSILTAVHPANSLGVWQYTIKLPPLSAGRHKFEFCIWGQCDQTEIVTLEKMQHLPLVSPGSLFFSMVEGGAMPPAQEVKVGFTYGGVVPWSATSDTDWLSVAPNAGEGEGQMSVSLVAAALPPPGTYTGKIAIKADEANSEPLVANCLLSIKRASSSPYGAFDTPTGTSSDPGGDIAVVVVSPRNPRLRKTDQGQDPAAGEEARRSHGLIDEFPFPPARPPERAKPAEAMFFPPARPSIRGKPAQ